MKVEMEAYYNETIGAVAGERRHGGIRRQLEQCQDLIDCAPDLQENQKNEPQAPERGDKEPEKSRYNSTLQNAIIIVVEFKYNCR